MTERQEIFEKMKTIEGYFQQCAADNKLFRPEFECAKAIREKVEHGRQLTTHEVEDILKVYNETTAGEHYNGSGWFNYQLHLRHLLMADNFEIEVENLSGQLRIVAG